MKTKYLILLCLFFFTVCSSPKAMPNFSFCENISSNFESNLAPILPKKNQPKQKTKPKKRPKNENETSFSLFTTFITIACSIFSVIGGVYLMNWLVHRMVNYGSFHRNNLLIAIMMISVAVACYLLFVISMSRSFIKGIIKPWVLIFYFIAFHAIIFAILFFIYGLLAQISIFLGIALGLVLFGILGVFLFKKVLDKVPPIPDEENDL